MAYGQNDPATDRRISRLSLISSAANLYAGSKLVDPDIVLTTAKGWEAWVYDGQPVVSGNGTETFAPAMPAPVLAPTCAECGNPLTEVRFKTGNTWTPETLAQLGQQKYGRVLCKQHYFGKKPVA